MCKSKHNPFNFKFNDFPNSMADFAITDFAIKKSLNRKSLNHPFYGIFLNNVYLPNASTINSKAPIKAK